MVAVTAAGAILRAVCPSKPAVLLEVTTRRPYTQRKGASKLSSVFNINAKSRKQTLGLLEGAILSGTGTICNEQNVFWLYKSAL